MKVNQKIHLSNYFSLICKMAFKHKAIHIHYQAGQALLVVVLVMVVALTVGLSVAVRSMTNIRVSSEDESSQRAFSAAEAGIERTLANAVPVSNSTLTNNTSYSTTLNTLSWIGFLAHNGTTILKDEPVDIWLSNYPDYASPWSGDLTVNWGSTGDSCASSEDSNTQAALEVVLISTTTPATPKSNNKITSYLLDPCDARRASNNFQAPVTPGSNIGGKNFAYKHTISVVSGLIARVIPLYASAVVGVEGSIALPAQGTIVSSTGVSGTTQRKIVSYRGYPQLPAELFPFIFFSPK